MANKILGLLIMLGIASVIITIIVITCYIAFYVALYLGLLGLVILGYSISYLLIAKIWEQLTGK
jgi:hypothetical protein